MLCIPRDLHLLACVGLCCLVVDILKVRVGVCMCVCVRDDGVHVDGVLLLLLLLRRCGSGCLGAWASVCRCVRTYNTLRGSAACGVEPGLFALFALLCCALLCYAVLCYAVLAAAMPCHAMPDGRPFSSTSRVEAYAVRCVSDGCWAGLGCRI